jgi:hypothetical protein
MLLSDESQRHDPKLTSRRRFFEDGEADAIYIQWSLLGAPLPASLFLFHSDIPERRKQEVVSAEAADLSCDRGREAVALLYQVSTTERTPLEDLDRM